MQNKIVFNKEIFAAWKKIKSAIVNNTCLLNDGKVSKKLKRLSACFQLRIPFLIFHAHKREIITLNELVKFM